MTKLKPCPICGIGKPRMVHYALPMKWNFDACEETEDCLFEPMLTYKRIECSNCGATTGLSLTCDMAFADWNEEKEDGNRIGIVQYITDEDMEVEE